MHTADQQYGPCSCQDDGRCLYVNGGPACMNEQQGAPTPRVDALLLEVDEGRVYKDYGPTVDLARQLERELSAKTAEAERLREALNPKIMPSVGLAIGTRLRDFYRNRFSLVNPVQHTDNERQVILAALKLLLAALAATRKEEGNG